MDNYEFPNLEQTVLDRLQNNRWFNKNKKKCDWIRYQIKVSKIICKYTFIKFRYG